MKSRSRALADKSTEAMLSAIETYNKPNFEYREETFTILATNAWELLLKARILQLDGNRISTLYAKEKRRNLDGSLSTKLFIKRNRSGTPMTIGLFMAYDRLVGEYGDTIPKVIRKNLELLVEVRDSAIHFMNKGYDISRALQELGTGCIRNYLQLTRTWFGIDLSTYNFFLMPLAFVGQSGQVDAVVFNQDERKLLTFLRDQIKTDPSNIVDDYAVALRIDVKFSRSKDAGGQRVIITNDPDAIQVTLSEEDIRERYPWDYKILTTRLRRRYKGFLENQKYHNIRKPLEAD